MKNDDSLFRSMVPIVIATACILLLPLVAMQVTDEVRWGPGDFVVAGILLLGTGLLYQVAARQAGTLAYRAAVGVALGTALVLVWVDLAVGLIGTEGDPANLMHLGVLAVGGVGAGLARLHPRGLARALYAMAFAQALVAVIAVVADMGAPVSGPVEILLGNGFFVALWVGSAWLFQSAATGTTAAATA
jgi:hypothetical protein